MQFKQGDVFLRKNTVHSFETALLGGCHFSRVPQIGLMFVARFSWVPNLYNIHFLVENHRPQPDPVNRHRVFKPIFWPKYDLKNAQTKTRRWVNVWARRWTGERTGEHTGERASTQVVSTCVETHAGNTWWCVETAIFDWNCVLELNVLLAYWLLIAVSIGSKKGYSTVRYCSWTREKSNWMQLVTWKEHCILSAKIET